MSAMMTSIRITGPRLHASVAASASYRRALRARALRSRSHRQIAPRAGLALLRANLPDVCRELCVAFDLAHAVVEIQHAPRHVIEPEAPVHRHQRVDEQLAAERALRAMKI